MSEAAGVRGIVVGHGDMPRGLVNAVRHIAGSAADGLEPLSNEGKGPQQLASELNELAGSGTVIVFSRSAGVASWFIGERISSLGRRRLYSVHSHTACPLLIRRSLD